MFPDAIAPDPEWHQRCFSRVDNADIAASFLLWQWHRHDAGIVKLIVQGNAFPQLVVSAACCFVSFLLFHAQEHVPTVNLSVHVFWIANADKAWMACL